MNTQKPPLWAAATAAVAVVFGLLTLKSGGSVLLDLGSARQAAGHYVPFVLWANTIAGGLYLAIGIGIWQGRRWAATAALLMTIFNLLLFAALGLHILNGGLYENRTIGAMSLRTLVWAGIAYVCHRNRA